MSILSLRDLAGSVVFKNNLNNTAPNNNNCNFILSQIWQGIKCEGLLPEIKSKALRIEEEILTKNACIPNSDEAVKLLTEKVNDLFINLCLSCNTKTVYGDIIPHTEVFYFQLGKKWEDEAFEVLWNRVSSQITVPDLSIPEEKRNWMKCRENAQQLSQILSLDLSSEHIKILPPELIFCTGLETLIFMDSPITEISQNLIMAKLESLHLINTEITILPENFVSQFPALKELFLNNNKLNTLPKNLKFFHLETLSINDNQLDTLPEDFEAPLLKHLFLENNKIMTLPNLKFPVLETLSLEGNSITVLPEGFEVPPLADIYLSK